MSLQRAVQRLVETVDLPENVRSELRSLARRNTQPPINAQQLEWLLVDTAKIQDLAVTDAKIDTLTAGKITAGTITGEEIIIATDSGGTAGTIRSDNYSAGSAGWQIDSDGNAEFNNIVARGTIDNDEIKIDNATIQFYDSNGNERGRIQGVSSWVDLIDEAGVVAIRYRNGSIELRHSTNVVASDLGVGGNLSVANGYVSAGDYLASGTSDTLNRPDPSTLPAGARWYDTDDAQPIWSDGTDWRYADGTLA